MAFSVGMWTWSLPYTRPEWWMPYLTWLKQAGCGHWTIKVADGVSSFNGDNLKPAFDAAREAGLHSWCWSYVRDSRYADPVAQGALLGTRAQTLSANGVIIDVEREWQQGDQPSASALVRAVRDAFSGPVYGSSYSTLRLHPEFPWDDFTPLLDGWMPQVYQTPAATWVLRSYTEFKATGKDVILTGIGSTQLGSPQDTKEFLQQCDALGITCNLWVYEQMNDLMWQIVSQFSGAS